MTTSKITSLQGNGTWEGKFGLMYKYDLTLENGDSGEYSSKKYTSVESLPFTIGTEIEYEFAGGDFPKIKSPIVAGTKRFEPKSSNGFNNDPERQKMIVRQSSLQRATELLIHNNQDGIVKPSDVIKYADFYAKWVMESNEKPTEQPKPAPVKAPAKAPSYEKDATYSSDNDLPF